MGLSQRAISGRPRRAIAAGLFLVIIGSGLLLAGGRTLATEMYSIKLDPATPEVGTRALVTLTPIVDVGAIAELRLRVFQGNQEVFFTDGINPAGASLRIYLNKTGAYAVGATARLTTGEEASQQIVFNVEPKPATVSETLQGILVILVSGGVLLALALAFAIVIRRPLRRQSNKNTGPSTRSQNPS